MNFGGVVTAANTEHETFLTYPYYYNEENIWLTGFPRFDRLKDSGKESKQITIMPTWRKTLMSHFDAVSLKWIAKADFENSDYVKFFSALLNDKRLRDAAYSMGYTIAFRPHPTVMDYLRFFDIPDDVTVDNRTYREIYTNSCLIINDYSSASMDFSYLRKPVLYWQFDFDDFFGGDHVCTEGYYDYVRDGFGEVEYTLDALVDRTIEYMRNGCKMKDEYKARADKFFAFSDFNSCARVYDNVMKLLDKNGKS